MRKPATRVPLTRVVVLLVNERTNRSSALLSSVVASRFVAAVRNATRLPSALITGFELWLFAEPPPAGLLTKVTVFAMSRMKTSLKSFVSSVVIRS